MLPKIHQLLVLTFLFASGCGGDTAPSPSTADNLPAPADPVVSADWDRLWSTLIETQRSVWDSNLQRTGDMDRARERLSHLQGVLDHYPDRGDGLDFLVQDFIAISHDYLSNIGEAITQVNSMLGKPKEQATKQLKPKLAELAAEKDEIVARYNKWQADLLAILNPVRPKRADNHAVHRSGVSVFPDG